MYVYKNYPRALPPGIGQILILPVESLTWYEDIRYYTYENTCTIGQILLLPIQRLSYHKKIKKNLKTRAGTADMERISRQRASKRKEKYSPPQKKIPNTRRHTGHRVLAH